MAYNEVLKRRLQIKRPLTIYILYWFLLSYIIGALIFWFIVLNRQNIQLSKFRLDMIDVDDVAHEQRQKEIADARDTNTAEYITEGGAFLFLIVAGAVFVFRAINRQFMQSEQQENFMMAITHELKTPIAVTKLNLETLQKRVLTPEQRQKLIAATIQEANRLNSLCNNMLLTTQIEAGGYKIMKEQVDLSGLLSACVHDFIIRFPNRTIETQIQEDLMISGDLLLLQLALNNILDNAIKYSGKEDIVLLKAFQTSREIFVEVIDEGVGIPPGEKEKIFEKYYRGHQDKIKGTGLGLYLTRKIIHEHKGIVKFRNNASRGSIFEIVLKKKNIF